MFRNPIRACALLAVVAFVAGYSKNNGYADEPAACDQYECKEIYAYWSGSDSLSVHQFHKNPGLGVTTNAMVKVYTTKSNHDLPMNNDLETIVWDYQYDKCYPWCGKDGAGAWQALQEVAVHEDANKQLSPRGQNSKNTCTQTENGQPGAKVNNPTNKNTGKHTPPGVKKQEDMGGGGPTPP